MKSLLDKLRKKKEAAAEFSAPDAAAESKSPQGLSVQRLIMYGLGAVLLIVVIVGIANYLQLLMLGKGQRSDAAAIDAANMAEQYGARLQGYSDIVTTAARSPETVAAMAGGNQAVLAQQSTLLRGMFPGALRVRFIAKGDDTIDDTTTPTLSYACLDLVRRAETKSVPPPVEVHLLGTKDQHLDIVRAIADKQEVVGSLLVSFDVGMLKLWLGPLTKENRGYVELRQSSGDNYLVLAATGEASLKGGNAPYVASVPGSSWQLAYWPSFNTLGLGAGQQVAFFTAYGIATAALIAIFLGLASIVARVVRNDLITVVKQAIDIWSGKRQHTYDVRLAESIEILTALEQRVQSAQPQHPPQIHPDPVKAAAMQEQGIVVDEVPDDEPLPPPSVLFMDKSAMEVEEMAPPPLYSRDDDDKDGKEKK